MNETTKTDLFLGLVVLALGLTIAFLWIPFDVETGIFEKVRRRTEIGDSFAPALAAGLLVLSGLLLTVEALRSPGMTRLSSSSMAYVGLLLLLFVVSLALMRWTGPLLAIGFGPDGETYRTLRDTVPWKYLGYVAGGTFMVSALIAFTERQLRWQSIAIGFVACCLLIALYDLPFDDLVLPPNGDV